MHFRVVRLTDYTVEIGAGEGRAYCQNRYKLPLWAQRLNDEGTQLVGEVAELFRNDQPWEGALVEGPFLRRRGEFHRGSGCG